MSKGYFLSALSAPVFLLILYFLGVVFRLQGFTFQVISLLLLPVSIAGVVLGLFTAYRRSVPLIIMIAYDLAGILFSISSLVVVFSSFSFSSSAYAAGRFFYGIFFVSSVALMFLSLFLYNLSDEKY